MLSVGWPFLVRKLLFSLAAPREPYFEIKPNDLVPLRVPNEEAFRIIKLFWNKFYNPKESNFGSLIPVNGTYISDSSYKFVVWSVIIAIASIADGANIALKEDEPKDSSNREIRQECLGLLESSYKIIGKYKHREVIGAYPASEYFPGNNDIYYDDDAQIGSALLFMYKATGDSIYFHDCVDNLEFLMTGYNYDENVASGGGMYWRFNSSNYINACTTSEAALVALRMVDFDVHQHLSSRQKKKYLRFAEDCIQWELDVLKDPEDNLIFDGLDPHDPNQQENLRNSQKFTYNSGTLLSALCYLYKITKDEKWYLASEEVLESVLNHAKKLFDQKYDAGNSDETIKQYWTDHCYFVQLLFEGLVDYLVIYTNIEENSRPTEHAEEDCEANEYRQKSQKFKVPKENVAAIKYELQRHLGFFQHYSFDPDDGLYYSNFQPYHINRKVYQRYIADFEVPEEQVPYDPDDQERVLGDAPVDEREMAKSLIGVGAAARVWFQAGRVLDRVEDKYFDYHYI